MNTATAGTNANLKSRLGPSTSGLSTGLSTGLSDGLSGAASGVGSGTGSAGSGTASDSGHPLSECTVQDGESSGSGLQGAINILDDIEKSLCGILPPRNRLSSNKPTPGLAGLAASSTAGKQNTSLGVSHDAIAIPNPSNFPTVATAVTELSFETKRNVKNHIRR